jgi:hypothetical protein
VRGGIGDPAEAVLGPGDQQPVGGAPPAAGQTARQPGHPCLAAGTGGPAPHLAAHAPLEQPAGLPRQGERSGYKIAL